MKLELVLPTLLTGATLVAVILYSLKRGLRESRELTLELESRSKANFDELMRDCRADLSRIEGEEAARAAAEAAGFDLVLSLDAGAVAGEVFVRVVEMLNELDEFARASGGTGLKLNTRQSSAESGTVTLRLVPADTAHDIAKQPEVVTAQSRKIAGVSEVELVTARSRKVASASAVEFAAA